MLLSELLPTLDQIAPLKFAESWDNVGLLAGNRESTVKRVLLTIDLTKAVAGEAIAWKADLIVAYHPPIFKPLKRLDFTSPLGMVLTKGIAIYSHHTALDVADGGTNDILADAVEMTGRRPLKSVEIADNPHVGMGRIGKIARMSRRDLAEKVKKYFGLESLLVAGSLDLPVERVAVCAGAGGELIHQAIKLGADAIITGELRHHDALHVAQHGLTAYCLRHSTSERKVLQPLADKIRKFHPNLEYVVSEQDQDPFEFL